jgi:hypothetical protein
MVRSPTHELENEAEEIAGKAGTESLYLSAGKTGDSSRSPKNSTGRREMRMR